MAVKDLHWAIRKRDQVMVTSCLTVEGTSPRRRLEGKTPLQAALSEIVQKNERFYEDKAFDIVRQLIAAGALPLRPDVVLVDCSCNRVNTPIEVNRKLIRLLKEQGVSVNGHNRDGDTALYVALNCENPAWARALIAEGADPTIPTREGHLPCNIFEVKPRQPGRRIDPDLLTLVDELKMQDQARQRAVKGVAAVHPVASTRPRRQRP